MTTDYYVTTIIIHSSPLIATINPLSTIIRPSNEGPTVRCSAPWSASTFAPPGPGSLEKTLVEYQTHWKVMNH